MVLRRKVASAYEDGAKKKVKQYGLIICVCVVAIYFLSSGRKNDEVINDIKPMNVRSKSKMNSFSGPYANENNQQHLGQPPPPQEPPQYQNQQQPLTPPTQQQPFTNQQDQAQQQRDEIPQTPDKSIDESVKGAQIDIEKAGHTESMRGQEKLLDKALEAASKSLRQNPIENKDIDPKSIESAVALRLEEEVSSKLAKVADNLIDEKESSLNEIVDEDKAEGLGSEEIKEDVAANKEMSIKELKQEISDEVHNIEQNLQEEASKIEGQVLKERLDRIRKQGDEEGKAETLEDETLEKGEEQDEDETEEVEKADETIDGKEVLAKTIKVKEEQNESSIEKFLEDNGEEVLHLGTSNIVPDLQQEKEEVKKVIP